MRSNEGKTLVWIVLSTCALLAVAIFTLVTIAVGPHVERWLLTMASRTSGSVPHRGTADTPPDGDTLLDQRTRDADSVVRSTLPIPVRPAEWVSANDYPASAIRAGQEGTVRAALDVDPRGRPIRCMVVQSSGAPALDAATCHVFMRSARFNGAPDGFVAARRWPGVRIRWVLPED
ncbi:hypothetical protein ASE75_08605 [Sphingomonas sp. Leaf17]|uniref:energy transducer TonB n=1 Tax=Sphingomonas sp. Leaf17 TaxID=1735683 RepID=UPI0006FC1D22|nr:energy transducer TonB [Sphingomonas sp. Leaf17]KQM65093.1 hypothetical protein ASE75_08605 [Sphingomonas sp. Leaf17]